MTKTIEKLNIPENNEFIKTGTEIPKTKEAASLVAAAAVAAAAAESAATIANQERATQQQEQNQEQQQVLSPSVYWAQTERLITLKVDLKDSKGAYADFTPKSVTFKARGYGARGFNEYKFDLRFYEIIDDEESFYRVTDNKIEFQIRKVENGWWPRLVATPQKPHWLKVDFDRWRTEDDVAEEKPRNVMQDYEQEYNRLQKEEFGYIKESTKKVYLIIYNLAMFVGYMYIMVVMAIMFYREGMASVTKTYERVGNAFKFCQLLQYLEVMHPLFGYTKGGPVMPFFQVSARNFILFLMIDMEPRMHAKPVVCYVFVIWALVELFRYPYYVSKLLRREYYLLTWLRYTIWLPLYPMGILCEGIILLRNLPYFEETQRLNLTMPNDWNVTFDMVTFLKIYLIFLILPGTYMVMSHMSKLRVKKLGTGNAKRLHVD